MTAKYQQSADQGAKAQDPLDDYRVPYTPIPEPRYSSLAARKKVYNYYDPITFDDTILVTPNKIIEQVIELIEKREIHNYKFDHLSDKIVPIS